MSMIRGRMDTYLKRRLQWYGHLGMRGEQEPTQQVLSITVQGETSRGRPRLRFLDTFRRDIREQIQTVIQLYGNLKIRNEIIRLKRDNESVRNFKESPGKEVDVVWSCDAKRGALCRKEGDGNESTREKEERKA